MKAIVDQRDEATAKTRQKVPSLSSFLWLVRDHQPFLELTDIYQFKRQAYNELLSGGISPSYSFSPERKPKWGFYLVKAVSEVDGLWLQRNTITRGCACLAGWHWPWLVVRSSSLGVQCERQEKHHQLNIMVYIGLTENKWPWSASLSTGLPQLWKVLQMVQLWLVDKTAVMILALPRLWVSREGGFERTSQGKCCRERLGKNKDRRMARDKAKIPLACVALTTWLQMVLKT